jgi:hypothetical protein
VLPVQPENTLKAGSCLWGREAESHLGFERFWDLVTRDGIWNSFWKLVSF